MDAKTWLMQVRYPYTAGMITIIWLGTAIFCYLAPEVSVEVVVTLAFVVTLVITLRGFTP